MNPISNNSLNPLVEHMDTLESVKRQTNYIGYFFVFSLGIIVTYLVLKYHTLSRPNDEEI
ncbi:MAG TPA: hypothetical protein VMV47_04955 [Bacteroidales bacterium]|nr:hypothetical protein [Bacteroidales bacterium]